MIRSSISFFLSILAFFTSTSIAPVKVAIDEPTAVVEDDNYDEYDYYVDTTSVVCSVEAGNVSLGYIIPPTAVNIDGETNCADILVDLLNENGYTPNYSGTTHENFYLSSITGIDTSSAFIPQSLQFFLENNKVEISNSVTDNSLGEFDFTSSSGWVYTVNSQMPNVGMDSYYPNAGDVIRFRYSLIYGADTGYHEDWGYDYTNYTIADSDRITYAIGLNGADNYSEYLDVISNIDTTQSEIDRIYSLITE